ncbi:protein phosphatase 2C domain-containing protein [Actinoplanes sp. CA-142083]|uniref:protein phosphatase 2C domain-containing protein n=1 Tax=Actinoplanes sp. CA-142083 TaxID=3239903 RepID=UPI003D8A816C
MLATESAAASSGLLSAVVGIGIVLVVVAAGLIVVRQRNGRDRQRIAVGSDLRPGESRPSAHPGARPRSRDRVRQVLPRKRAKTPPEPWLNDEVVLYGPWFSTVCHGYCGPRDDSRLAVRAATLRGLSHRYDGTPGQDVLGVVWNPRRMSLFAVVADGLGSLPESGEAARFAVQAALRTARRLPDRANPAIILGEAGEAVRQYNGHGEMKGTATMVVAEIRRTRSEAHVTTWGVGDSEAWLLRGGRWGALHHERRAGRENVTRHLPHDESSRTERRVPAGTVVLLATDGFASALGSGSPLGAELAESWQRPPAPLDFLAQVDFEDDHFTDDRAAVAVWIR